MAKSAPTQNTKAPAKVPAHPLSEEHKERLRVAVGLIKSVQDERSGGK